MIFANIFFSFIFYLLQNGLPIEQRSWHAAGATNPEYGNYDGHIRSGGLRTHSSLQQRFLLVLGLGVGVDGIGTETHNDDDDDTLMELRCSYACININTTISKTHDLPMHGMIWAVF